MRIGETLNTQDAHLTFLKYQKQQEEKLTASPISWGEDKVSFSAEAQSKAQATTENREDSDDEALNAADQFKSYLDKTKGKTTGGSDPEAQIKALQEKLVALQAQMSKTAADDTMPSEAKESKISSINAQINSILSQIAELQSELAAMPGAEEA